MNAPDQPGTANELSRDEAQAMLAACTPGSTDFLAMCDKLTRRKLAALCRAYLAQLDRADEPTHP